MLYLFLADGFEETEALATLDILRRAECATVSVGIGGGRVTGSHRISVVADITDREAVIEKCSGVILPGGIPGAENLENSELVRGCVMHCEEKGYPIAAICAAPYVLGKWRVLKGRAAVCYPGYEKYLTGAKLSEASVCTDGKIITGKGAGVAVDFALAIVSLIKGKAAAEMIRGSMQCK